MSVKKSNYYYWKAYTLKMITKIVLLVLISVLVLSVSGENRAKWMRDRGWGVMTHYLAHSNMTANEWNKLIDNFNVSAIASQLNAVKTGYYQITIGQNSGYYLSPNTVYDQIVGIKPSRLSTRDLVSDLYVALNKHDIKLMAYLPSGAPVGDQSAVTALEFTNGPHRNLEFQLKWEKVIAEWSKRWGEKVSGWWFDGVYWPDSMYRFRDPPNFRSFAAAARAGNPQSSIAFNQGVVYRVVPISPEADFTAGEINEPQLVTAIQNVNGTVDGTQVHFLSYLGQTWGSGKPRFTAEQVVNYTKHFWSYGAAVTWDVPIELNGTISQPFIDQLTEVAKAFKQRT